MRYIDPFELAIFLTNHEDDWEEAIETKYGMNYQDFERLINDLVPLITIAESPLTNRMLKGFADISHGIWLVKIEESE